MAPADAQHAGGSGGGGGGGRNRVQSPFLGGNRTDHRGAWAEGELSPGPTDHSPPADQSDRPSNEPVRVDCCPPLRRRSPGRNADHHGIGSRHAGRPAAQREDHRARPGSQRRERSGAGCHQPDHLERPGERDLRHHRRRDRRRLHRSPLQLQRGRVPRRRPAGRGGHGGAHPNHEHRGRPLRHRAGRHRQQCPRRRRHVIHADGGPPTDGASRSSSRSRTASTMPSSARPSARRRPAQRLRRRHWRAGQLLRRRQRDPAAQRPWRHSTSPPCPRCSSSAPTCATRPTPPCSPPHSGNRPSPEPSPPV